MSFLRADPSNEKAALIAATPSGVHRSSQGQAASQKNLWQKESSSAGVGLAAVLCAWFVSARNQADEQDALVASIGSERNVYVEQFGPQWLDLVGAGRFRRRIVAARVDDEEMTEEVFERLARLRKLRILDINPWHYEGPFVFTRGMAAALVNMRQVRLLNVACMGEDLDESSRNATHECLTAVGKLSQLERLRVEMWEERGDELACLAGLTNLKMLTLDIIRFVEDDKKGASDVDGEALTLAHLPVLPRLEALDLNEPDWVNDSRIDSVMRRLLH